MTDSGVGLRERWPGERLTQDGDVHHVQGEQKDPVHAGEDAVKREENGDGGTSRATGKSRRGRMMSSPPRPRAEQAEKKEEVIVQRAAFPDARREEDRRFRLALFPSPRLPTSAAPAAA